MTWSVIVGHSARRSIRKLPRNDAERVARALIEMEDNPFSGDVVTLRGKHQGSFRRRVGSWRIFFEIDNGAKRVIVNNVLRRTSRTY